MHAEEFFFRNMLLDKCLHFVNHSVSLLLYLIFQIKDFGSLTLLLTSKGIQILFQGQCLLCILRTTQQSFLFLDFCLDVFQFILQSELLIFCSLLDMLDFSIKQSLVSFFYLNGQGCSPVIILGSQLLACFLLHTNISGTYRWNIQ